MPSKLIDEFVKSLCLGLEEMICCGMINLATVGGREWRIPKRGVSVMTSNDSESEGDASSVSNSTSASTSFSISNLDRAASRIYVRYFWIPDQSWCNWHKSCRSRWRWYLIHNSWRLGSSITHVSLGGEHWSWRAALLHHLLIVNALRVVALPVLF